MQSLNLQFLSIHSCFEFVLRIFEYNINSIAICPYKLLEHSLFAVMYFDITGDIDLACLDWTIYPYCAVLG